MIELDWDHDSGEGSVKISKEFTISNRMLQLDALKDWIYELTEIYDVLLGEEFLGGEYESKR